MDKKDISEIEFNDIAFFEQENRKAIILYGKTEKTAKNLHKSMQKGFTFKSKPENNGNYTIGLDVFSYDTTLFLETQLTKEKYPQLVWLQNSLISDLIIAYKKGGNTELIQPSFPLNSLMNLN